MGIGDWAPIPNPQSPCYITKLYFLYLFQIIKLINNNFEL